MKTIIIIFILLISSIQVEGQNKRARDLGIPLEGITGKLNALIAAETMVGINNTKIYELPENRLIEILKKYNRIIE